MPRVYAPATTFRLGKPVKDKEAEICSKRKRYQFEFHSDEVPRIGTNYRVCVRLTSLENASRVHYVYMIEDQSNNMGWHGIFAYGADNHADIFVEAVIRFVNGWM